MTTGKLKHYGRLNTKTIRKCVKDKALAKALIIAYIDQRANMNWSFNIYNITNETGITLKTVKGYVKQLEREGVLTRVPREEYTDAMKSNMAYHRLNKTAYEAQYWTEAETAESGTASNVGNESPDKSVKDSQIEPQKVGNDSAKVGNRSSKVGNDSQELGNGYPEKSVTATPLDNREECRGENRERDREKDSPALLPSSLSSSTDNTSKLQGHSVHPFSQPIFSSGSDRAAGSEDQAAARIDENQGDSSQCHSTSSTSSGVPVSPPGHNCQNGQASFPVNGVNQPNSALPIEPVPSQRYKYKVAGDSEGGFFPVNFEPREEDAALSADEKVAVLKRSLNPFTTIGQVEFQRGAVMAANGRGFQLARQWFDLNPGISVASLLKILWECNRVACENPMTETGFKPSFTHHAAAESLTYFMQNLDIINGTMEADFQLPEKTVYLEIAPKPEAGSGAC